VHRRPKRQWEKERGRAKEAYPNENVTIATMIMTTMIIYNGYICIYVYMIKEILAIISRINTYIYISFMWL